MIDAYTIGITLALNNGVSDGIAAIRQELQQLDRAVNASALGLAHLNQIAGAAVAGVTADVAQMLEAARKVSGTLPKFPAAVDQDTVEPKDVRTDRSQPPAAPEPIEGPAAQPTIPPAQEQPSPAAPAAAAEAPVQHAPTPPSIVEVPLSPPSSKAPYPSQAETPPPRPAAPTVPSAPLAATPSRSVPQPDLGDASERTRSPVIISERLKETPRSTQPHAPAPVPVDFAAVARTLAPIIAHPRPANDLPKSEVAPERDLPRSALGDDEPEQTGSPKRPPDNHWSATEKARDRIPEALFVAPSDRNREREIPEHDPDRSGRVPPPAQFSAPGHVSPSKTPVPLLHSVLPSAAKPQTRADTTPTTVEVILDGASIGRWIDQRMAKASTRPPSGTTFFDPRVTPVWTTMPLGN